MMSNWCYQCLISLCFWSCLRWIYTQKWKTRKNSVHVLVPHPDYLQSLTLHRESISCNMNLGLHICLLLIFHFLFKELIKQGVNIPFLRHPSLLLNCMLTKIQYKLIIKININVAVRPISKVHIKAVVWICHKH